MTITPGPHRELLDWLTMQLDVLCEYAGAEHGNGSEAERLELEHKLVAAHQWLNDELVRALAARGITDSLN